MTHKSPPRRPSASGPEQEDELQPAAAAPESAEANEAPDPYDDLWDPDMDTRPERIRKTKARSRTDARTRGGATPRGKRREGT